MSATNGRQVQVKIRLAALQDLDAIREVDVSAWSEDVAFTPDQLRAQISTFPQGLLVAESVERNESRKESGRAARRATAAWYSPQGGRCYD